MRTRTKLIATMVCMVVVIAAMVVGVWAATSGTAGVTVGFTYANTGAIQFETRGQIYNGKTSATAISAVATGNETMNYNLALDGTETGSESTTKNSWAIGTMNLGSGGASFTAATDYIYIIVSIKNTTGTSIKVTPTYPTLSLTNMEVNYKSSTLLSYDNTEWTYASLNLFTELGSSSFATSKPAVTETTINDGKFYTVALRFNITAAGLLSTFTIESGSIMSFNISK